MANLFSDDFNRADNDSLGASWTEHLGDWDISSNKVVITTTGAVSVAHIATVSTADYTVQCVMNFASSSGAYQGIVGRRVNYGSDSSGYFWHVVSGGMSSQALHRRVSGGWTQLGTSSQALSTATDYTVKLSMQGTAIKCYIDGVEKISVTDSTITAAGDAGLKSDGNTIPTWDDFTVDDFAGGVTSHALEGAATCTSTTVAGLLAGLILAGSAASVATTSGSLSIGTALQGSAAGVSSTTGSANVGLSVEGSAGSVSTTAGTAGAGLALNGAASGTSTTTGDLTIGGAPGSHALSGTADGVSTTSGGLSGGYLLRGTAGATSTTAASLGVGRPLSGAAVSASGSTGALLTGAALTGTATGTTTAGGGLVTGHALGGTADGASTTTGDLSGGSVVVPVNLTITIKEPRGLFATTTAVERRLYTTHTTRGLHLTTYAAKD